MGFVPQGDGLLGGLVDVPGIAPLPAVVVAGIPDVMQTRTQGFLKGIVGKPYFLQQDHYILLNSDSGRVFYHKNNLKMRSRLFY